MGSRVERSTAMIVGGTGIILVAIIWSWWNGQRSFHHPMQRGLLLIYSLAFFVPTAGPLLGHGIARRYGRSDSIFGLAGAYTLGMTATTTVVIYGHGRYVFGSTQSLTRVGVEIGSDYLYVVVVAIAFAGFVRAWNSV